MGSARRVALLAGASIAVGVLSSTGRGREIDESIFKALNRGHGPIADRLCGATTELGSLWASGTAAAVLALRGHRAAAARSVAAATVAWLVGQEAKRVVMRPRPFDAMPEETRLLIGRPQATSWPSSHPAVLASFLVVGGRRLGLGRSARLLLGAAIGAVAASRVYLGVHYPSDVAGGLLMGAAVAEAVGSLDSTRR